MTIGKNIRGFILSKLPARTLFCLKKMHYVHSLRRFSEKKEQDIRVVRNIIKRGDYVIDIGAHVGWYTTVLSRLVGDEGRVYSIEPVPPTFDLLSFCVKRLKLQNVTLLNCAISDSNGSSIMEVPRYEEGGDNFYRAKLVTRNNEDATLRQYRVTLDSLDSLFLKEFSRVSFIKCDVEGHELQVLKGAKKFMAACKPTWLVEVSGDPQSRDSSAFKVFRIFSDWGYSAWWCDQNHLRKYSAGDTSVNYFFLTDDQASRIVHLEL